VGLLQPRHVQIDETKYIGKQSNGLEDVEPGLIHSEQNLYTEYPDPRRDERETKTQPALMKIPLSRVVKMSRMSRSALKEMRAGRSTPHRRNLELLMAIVRSLAAISR
jgi:hypothetical protein